MYSFVKKKAKEKKEKKWTMLKKVKIRGQDLWLDRGIKHVSWYTNSATLKSKMSSNGFLWKVVQKRTVPENYQVIAIEWLNSYCFLNDSIILEEVEKNFWNVWKCLHKPLTSVWENVLILPSCLHILVINFLELFKNQFRTSCLFVS